MSQDAYALFQTIKKIKGYIMIRTSTYATPKYALSDTYLVSPITNIAGHQVIPLAAPVVVSNSIPAVANHATIALNGSNRVRLTVWVAGLLSGLGIRIVGWSKTKDNKYVPSLLYYGEFQSAGTDASTILGDALVPVLAFAQPTKGPSSTANTTNTFQEAFHHNFTGYAPIPGSLVLNTLGYTHLDFEFVATAAASNKCNVYVTEI